MVSWNRWGSWLTMPMAARSDSCVRSRTSMPSTRTAPLVTSYSRGTSWESVVLPAPDGPTSATSCPGSISADTPRSTSDGFVGRRPRRPDGFEAGNDRIGRVAEADVPQLDAAAGETRSTAPGRSGIGLAASSTSKTRSKDTSAVITSTRALVSDVSGP